MNPQDHGYLLELLDRIAKITAVSSRLEQVDMDLERRVAKLEATMQEQSQKLDSIERKIEGFKVYLISGTIIAASLGSGLAQFIGRFF